MIPITEIKMSVPYYKPSLEERETIICFNELDSTAEVFTYNPALIRKLDALTDARSDEVTCTRAESINGVGLRQYIVPKKWVKVNASRIISEEERAKRAEMMARNCGFELKSHDNNRATEK